MKYGIRNRCFNTDWKEAVEAAGKLGFDGVELIVANDEQVATLKSDAGREEVLGWCKEAGCAISSLSCASFRKVNFAHSGEPMEKGVAYVNDCLHAARGLGADACLFPHFERERIDVSPSEEQAFIDGFQQSVPVAAELQVYATLETSFSVEQLQRIVDGVASPWFGVYQDVANAISYGHDSVDMLLRLERKRIPIIHIKEYNGALLGEGEVPWEGVFHAIKKIGYDGWLVFETQPTDDPMKAAAFNLRFTRKGIEG